MIRAFNHYISPKSLVLVLLETLSIALAWLLAAKIRYWFTPGAFTAYVLSEAFPRDWVLSVVVFQVCLYVGDLYDLSRMRSRQEQMILLSQALGSALLVVAMIHYLFPPAHLARGLLTVNAGMVLAFVTSGRLAFDSAWKWAVPVENVIILGLGPMALKAAREILGRPDLNLRIVGFVDPSEDQERWEGDSETSRLCGAPVLGNAARLEEIIRQNAVSRAVVALDDRRGRMPMSQLVRVRVSGVRVDDAQSIVSSLTGRVCLALAQPSWFIFTEGFYRSPRVMLVKRVSDVVLATVGLILAAPLMALIAVLIRLDSRGGVIYRQERVGLHGCTFNVLKFRSMRADAEAAGARWAQTDDSRATRVGRYLRKFRLDELPQLVNVLRGDMSMIGPRPERPVFVEQLVATIPYYNERHSIRPGITGWAQVQYRYGASVDDAACKLEYDLFYAKNMSFLFDCMIALKTIRIVLTAEGAR